MRGPIFVRPQNGLTLYTEAKEPLPMVSRTLKSLKDILRGVVSDCSVQSRLQKDAPQRVPRSFVWQSFLALLPSGSLAVIGLGHLFA